MLHLRLRENKRIHRRLFPMLSFKELEEKKKTNVKINPKLDDLKEKTKHGEDCTCIKCDKRRENDEGDDGPTVESYRVLARDKGDKGRPAQFRYKDEKDANKFADSIKSKGGKATVAKEEVVDEATRLKKEQGYQKGGTKKPSGKKDAALSFVLDKIRKEHGKGAVVGQGSKQQKKVKGAKSSAGTGKYLKRAKAKAQTAADAKKRGFKSSQDYVNTMARYGGKDNYDKGRGLGT